MREWTEKHIIELIKRYGGGGGGTGSAVSFFRVTTNTIQDLGDKDPFKVIYNGEIISLEIRKASYKTSILPAIPDNSGIYRTGNVVQFLEVETSYVKDGIHQFNVDFAGSVLSSVEITGTGVNNYYDAIIRGRSEGTIQPMVAYTGNNAIQWGTQLQIVSAYAPSLFGTAQIV